MSFFEIYERLCAEIGVKPQNKEWIAHIGVTSGTVTGWKNGSSPHASVLCRLADLFDVSTDYLLGRTNLRKLSDLTSAVSDKEQVLLDAYRSTDAEGQCNIIHVCISERNRARAEQTAKGEPQVVG